MEKFIQQHAEKVTGVVSGFDRLVLRGSLRMLSYTAGMMGFLSAMGVLLKDFGEYVETMETTSGWESAKSPPLEQIAYQAFLILSQYFQDIGVKMGTLGPKRVVFLGQLC